MVNLIIRAARHSDIPAIQPMLERWVTDVDTGELLTDEIANDTTFIRAGINSQGSTRFLVAEADSQTLGIMGIQPPSAAMLSFATTKHPAELTYALVSEKAQGRGIGTALVHALSTMAINEGSTEFIVASSYRYQKSGWPFWEKLFGESVGMAKGYGGSGGDAKVWRKILDKPE